MQNVLLLGIFLEFTHLKFRIFREFIISRFFANLSTAKIKRIQAKTESHPLFRSVSTAGACIL